MKTFHDLEFNPHSIGNGLHAKMNFDNGYGVSVIKHTYSYGYEKNLWKVAILYKGKLCYDTHITDDVLGWQTEDDVTNVMKQVQELSSNEMVNELTKDLALN